MVKRNTAKTPHWAHNKAVVPILSKLVDKNFAGKTKEELETCLAIARVQLKQAERSHDLINILSWQSVVVANERALKQADRSANTDNNSPGS